MINEKKANEYQVKVPERVVNNFLSIYMQSDGMITIYWDDSKEDEGVSETKFPYGEIADRYAEEFILPWFKRCMDDFPDMEGWQPIGARQENIEVWFNKWFSQFIEKGEENGV